MTLTDKIFMSLVFITLLGFLVLLVLLVPDRAEQTSKAKQISRNMNCEFIGGARDLQSVYFLDCNGEVKMIRVER